MLEVRVLHVEDAVAAEAGGADRLELVGALEDGGMSPEPREVAAVRAKTNILLRPIVRLREGFSTDGGEAVRLRGLASSYMDAGADGLVLGFLNGLGGVDVEVVSSLLQDWTCPWTFSRAFDSAFDTDEAWAVVKQLPGLDGVRTAGSARSMEHGLDGLLHRARTDAAVAPLIVADGSVHPDHVPWLARVGVRQFHVAEQVRVGSSFEGPVDEGLVRSWRLLVDAEVRHSAARG